VRIAESSARSSAGKVETLDGAKNAAELDTGDTVVPVTAHRRQEILAACCVPVPVLVVGATHSMLAGLVVLLSCLLLQLLFGRLSEICQNRKHDRQQGRRAVVLQ
jgi:hypothetical protein